MWMNAGVGDKPYTEETRQQLLPRMAKEYSLYHWIKSRFYRQIREMKFSGRSASSMYQSKIWQISNTMDHTEELVDTSV